MGDTNPPSERDPETISLMNNSGFPDTLGILGLTSAVFGIAVFRDNSPFVVSDPWGAMPLNLFQNSCSMAQLGTVATLFDG